MSTFPERAKNQQIINMPWTLGEHASTSIYCSYIAQSGLACWQTLNSCPQWQKMCIHKCSDVSNFLLSISPNQNKLKTMWGVIISGKSHAGKQHLAPLLLMHAQSDHCMTINICTFPLKRAHCGMFIIFLCANDEMAMMIIKDVSGVWTYLFQWYIAGSWGK